MQDSLQNMGYLFWFFKSYNMINYFYKLKKDVIPTIGCDINSVDTQKLT